jgi:putative DNA primase/helicase
MAKPRSFPFTDVGNAERLAQRFYGDFRFIPGWGRFIIWNERRGRWEDDPHGVGITRLAKATLRLDRKAAKPDAKDSDDTKSYKKNLEKWLRGCESWSRINAMTKLVRDEPGVEGDHRKIDDKPMFLNCANGVLDLKKRELRKFRGSDLLMRQTAVRYDPKARSERWDAFLLKVVPDAKTREFLQRFVGYCLTADVSERAFVVIHGPRGRNGKSVFLRVLQELLGPYATTAAPGLLMAREKDAHPAEIADLHGARLVVASETRKGRTFDEEQTKRVTGNDILKARRMGENWWSFYPTFKLIVVANHRPRVKDASDSFWDRIILILFKTRIEKAQEDRDLIDKLTSGRELSGILNWAVDGFMAWREKGLAKPELVEAATNAYRADEDQVGQFCEDRLEFGNPLYRINNADLVRAAKGWAEKNDKPPVYETDLRERLELEGCEKHKSNGARGWRGVRLRPTADAVPAADPEKKDADVIPLRKKQVKSDSKGSRKPPKGQGQ